MSSPRPQSIAIFLILLSAFAVEAQQTPTPSATADAEDVHNGALKLATLCGLSAAEGVVVEDDLREMFEGYETTPRLFVLGCLALHDQWATGADYVTGKPVQGLLTTAEARCCLDKTVALAATMFGREFADAVAPLYMSLANL